MVTCQEECALYANSVKETFRDKPEKYEEFVNVFRDYKVRRAKLVDVTARLHEITKDHPKLFRGFSAFLLPRELYRFQMVGRRPAARTTDDFLLYLDSVKETFHDEPSKQNEFINLVKYCAPRADFARVEEFLKDNRRLLLGFCVFAPMRDYISKASKGLGQFRTIQTMVGKRVSHVLTMADACAYVAFVEEAFHDQPEKYKEFVKILFTAHRFDHAETIAKAEKLMKDHWNLFHSFSAFLSAEPKITLPSKTAPDYNLAFLSAEPKITIPPETAHDNNQRKRARVSDGADCTNRPKTRSQSRRDAAQVSIGTR